MVADDRTTIHLHESTKERLEELKPYPSMSFNDLLVEMADIYEEDQRGDAC